jgi:hypothetical protein
MKILSIKQTKMHGGADDSSGITHHLPSRSATLLRSALWCLQRVGLLRIFGELRSCFYRIVRPEKIIGVPFEELQERAQRVYREAGPVRTQRYPYMPGIEALCRQRPWLTWQDLELFLQGWFHAELALLRSQSTGMGCGTPVAKDSQRPPEGLAAPHAESNSTSVQT